MSLIGGRASSKASRRSEDADTVDAQQIRRTSEATDAAATIHRGGAAAPPADVLTVAPSMRTSSTSLITTSPSSSSTQPAGSHALVATEGGTSLPPPITFPYKLDIFQSTSIGYLEAGESVLVSAHTSAGKTTVALYAIAKALRERKRVIYTSPIKALSNQKFREFSDRFDSVGLMTGDTTIKPEADCLVMTTEILRSMLYRGTEMLREVGCVVFDEVHYMRDKSRGVVWEETIILLPKGCQYVFLSATIPNTDEFAAWVEHVHPGTRCHVVHTNMRPVPLQHYLYPAGAEGIFQIIDEASKFREDNFVRAMAVLSQAAAGGGVGGGVTIEGATSVATSRTDGDDGHEAAATVRGQQRTAAGKGKKGNSAAPILHIIRLAMDRNMYPIIVFCFAKAECERNALALAKLNFNNEEEDAMVQEVYHNAMESLSEDDRRLPAVEHLLPLLRRGVGIHHSGLLPILKEVVEVLFQAGLVKCLFSTETFSMGLNMPARTVVFTAVKKFDGEKQRYLTSGEYIQMSGRAGRRGLDRVGVVIAMVDKDVEAPPLKQLMAGGADTLNSSFHLTYNMVLNLLRVEDVDPQFMMDRSFYQFQRERNRPALEAKVATIEQELASRVVSDEFQEIFEEHDACLVQLEALKEQTRLIRMRPKYINSFLVAGRLVKMRRPQDGANFGWGIAMSYDKTQRLANEDDPDHWTVEVAVICAKPDEPVIGGPGDKRGSRNPSANAADNGGVVANQRTLADHAPMSVTDFTTETGDLYFITFPFSGIADLSRLKVALPPAPTSELGRLKIVETLSKLAKQFGDLVPPITPQELGVAGADDYVQSLQKMILLEKQLEKNELRNNPPEEMTQAYETFKERKSLERAAVEAREELKLVQRTVLTDELKKMLRVLRRLDYLDQDDLILRKGRVACEIASEDESELLLTELLFRGTFVSMDVEMICAVLSCLVNVTKTPDNFSLPELFQQPLKDLKDIVSRIATASVEAGLVSAQSGGSGGANTDKVLPSLMEVTYKWAKGAKFVDLMGMTSAYEGDIVRMMRRLEELLRQLAGAARSPAIGSVELFDKFTSGIGLIKRDIVFASSLYL